MFNKKLQQIIQFIPLYIITSKSMIIRCWFFAIQATNFVIVIFFRCVCFRYTVDATQFAQMFLLRNRIGSTTTLSYRNQVLFWISSTEREFFFRLKFEWSRSGHKAINKILFFLTKARVLIFQDEKKRRKRINMCWWDDFAVCLHLKFVKLTKSKGEKNDTKKKKMLYVLCDFNEIYRGYCDFIWWILSFNLTLISWKTCASRNRKRRVTFERKEEKKKFKVNISVLVNCYLERTKRK